jgi:Fe-S-cluster containining protein
MMGRDRISPLCADCGGACCLLATIQPRVCVDNAELECLRERGAIVENEDYVGLKSRCRHFIAGRCGIYPDRPSYCMQFEAGVAVCKEVRRLYGVQHTD